MLRSDLTILAVSLPLLATGCAGGSPHSALDPAGVQAGRIAGLWWIFFWVSAGVYVVTMAVILLAAFRRRPLAGTSPAAAVSPTVVPSVPPPVNLSPDPRRERSIRNTVGGALACTVALLVVLLVSDVLTARAVHGLAGDDPDPLVVKVTGHQWWWEVQYDDKVPVNVVTTANELHLPVGKVAKLEIRSADVIHSFWVPNLHGKKDMIPGHDTAVWLRADRIGTYAGGCAEFCGAHHAQMRLTVTVESPAQFDAWLAAQRQSAPEPQTDGQKAGREVFLTRGRCAMCHTVTGTTAMSRVGPDLTHLASRPTLAAGARPYVPGHLAGWVVDPQKVKPGVRMPQNPMSPTDLRALLEYLESLK
jgi:cytochrome c oxidase subunit 2